ncbi:MAG: hypothetical protein K6343_06455 [Caldisericaceae bacterium]
MRKNDIFTIVIYLVLLLFDIAISNKIPFLFTVSFLVVDLVIDFSNLYLNIALLLINDLIFGNFMGEYASLVVIGVFLYKSIFKRLKTPKIFGLLTVFILLFFGINISSKNLVVSFDFFFYNFLVSTVILFIMYLISYGKAKV